MFSFDFLIAQLYGDRSAEELQRLADVGQDLSDFSSDGWKRIYREQLPEETVQLRIAKTIFEASQGEDADVPLRILDALESWSDVEPEVPFTFSALEENDQAFYQRVYAIIGFLFFQYIGLPRQCFLLQSRFLLLAYVWQIPVYVHVQEHFERMIAVSLMSEDAAGFAGCIATNPTPLGTQGRTVKPISEWIADFDAFESGTIENRVDEYIDSSMQVQRLDEKGKALLNSVLTLYFGLKGGFIWREIEDVVPPGYERKEKKEGKSLDEYYLQLLYQAPDDQFVAWLGDYTSTAKWIDISGKNDLFITLLLYVVKSKMDIKNKNQVKNVVGLLNDLKERGADNIDQMFVFDQAKNTFAWDEQFFAGVTPNDILDPKPFFDAAVAAAKKAPQKDAKKDIDVTQTAPTIGEFNKKDE